MKVKIVDKKEDVKEMTIEELAQERFVGVEIRSLKAMLYDWGGKFAFIIMPNSGVCRKWDTRLKCIKEGKKQGQLHVFDTAHELYLWMAE